MYWRLKSRRVQCDHECSVAVLTVAAFSAISLQCGSPVNILSVPYSSRRVPAHAVHVTRWSVTGPCRDTTSYENTKQVRQHGTFVLGDGLLLHMYKKAFNYNPVNDNVPLDSTIPTAGITVRQCAHDQQSNSYPGSDAQTFSFYNYLDNLIMAHNSCVFAQGAVTFSRLMNWKGNPVGVSNAGASCSAKSLASCNR